ncbi:MAG: PspA/IM30 family protein [Firmicutes bacterium]|nr:PspA/IM30 family protein [Bacillota bacterium]
MANILSRFSDIISSNINALLDKAEDPAKMIDQYLRKASEDLAEVKANTAAVIAEEKRCKRMLDDCNAEVEKYSSLAKKALSAGNEGDARVFIAKKQSLEENLVTLQKNYDVAHANATKMRQMHDKLVDDIEALKQRRNNIKATMAVAETQKTVNKAQEAYSGANGSIAGFERMEEKAQRMLDESMAAAELSEKPTDEAKELEAKYSGSNAATVDAELARMKAEMGL